MTKDEAWGNMGKTVILTDNDDELSKGQRCKLVAYDRRDYGVVIRDGNEIIGKSKFHEYDRYDIKNSKDSDDYEKDFEDCELVYFRNIEVDNTEELTLDFGNVW